jgi:nicotinate-nucleotide adenylyltransferase
MVGRLGIFGGSFDPVHLGHTAVARTSRDRLRLDRVLFVPNRTPPHKGVVASARHRLEMVRIAIRNEEGMEASDRELRRDGASYTIDTLREIRKEMGEEGEVFFIVGSDSLPEIPAWRESGEIPKMARVVAVSRAGAPREGKFEADLLRIDPVRISSTEIRDRVRRGLDLRGWVHPDVEDYIRRHHLYVG